MNRTIETVQAEILKKKKRIDKLRGEVDLLHDELKTMCDHKDTALYKWTHNNGYGRHTKMVGKECVGLFLERIFDIGMMTNDVQSNSRHSQPISGGYTKRDI